MYDVWVVTLWLVWWHFTCRTSYRFNVLFMFGRETLWETGSKTRERHFLKLPVELRDWLNISLKLNL
jgi:hypothetical protein